MVRDHPASVGRARPPASLVKYPNPQALKSQVSIFDLYIIYVRILSLGFYSNMHSFHTSARCATCNYHWNFNRHICLWRAHAPTTSVSPIYIIVQWEDRTHTHSGGEQKPQSSVTLSSVSACHSGPWYRVYFRRPPFQVVLTDGVPGRLTT